jgi:hypothetical protein
MSKIQTVFTFYADPGHGWLKVSKAELRRLGIIHQISGYSYQHGDFAYLEEDCDMSIFCRAKDARQEPVEFRPSYAKNSSRIRNYKRFEGGAA